MTGLRGPNGDLGIKPRVALCEAHALLAVLLLRPLEEVQPRCLNISLWSGLRGFNLSIENKWSGLEGL